MQAALSRRDREQLRHRQEILTAAEQVFAAKGFHNATMEDIAQLSEFAIGSLYKHFKSKESIFRALFEDRLTGYVEGLEHLLEQTRPFLALLDEFLQYYGEFGDSNQAFFRLLHNSGQSMDWHKEDIRGCIEPNMERYLQCVRRLMTLGVADGHLRALPVEDLTSFALGTLQGFFFQTLKRENVSMRQKVPIIRSLLLAGAGAGTTLEFS